MSGQAENSLTKLAIMSDYSLTKLAIMGDYSLTKLAFIDGKFDTDSTKNYTY
jgi:hypothetical protein